MNRDDKNQDHHGSSASTLVSLAHGINHAQSALKPLVFPLVLRDLNFGYSELGLLLGVAAAVGATNPILQTLVAQSSSGRIRDTGFAWFYTATFFAGALWSPAVGYLGEWLGLKAAFGAMAASFVLASVCVLFGRLHQIAGEHASATVVHSHH